MELHYCFLIQFFVVLVYHKKIVGSGVLLHALTFRIFLVEGGKYLLNVTQHSDPHLTTNSVI